MRKTEVRAVVSKALPALCFALQLQGWKIGVRYCDSKGEFMGMCQADARYQTTTFDIDP